MGRPKGSRNKTSNDKKHTLKATTKPTQRDLGWVAGFLEGEGTFYKTNTNSQIVSATQKQREPLNKLVALLGGSVGSYVHRQHHEPFTVYRWRVCGARARGVMMTLYALLSQRRREQVQSALAS